MALSWKKTAATKQFLFHVVVVVWFCFVLQPTRIECRLAQPLPQACKHVLDCVFESKPNDYLEPRDLYEFPHLISLRDRRPNSTIMDDYKVQNRQQTSAFRIQKIFAGGLVFIRSGMLFKCYEETSLYPRLPAVNIHAPKLTGTLQDCVDFYCKYVTYNMPLLECSNMRLANMHLTASEYTTAYCLETIRYVDFRGTSIHSTELSMYNLRYVYHLNLLYGRLVNNTYTDLERLLQSYPRAVIIELPGRFEFLDLCRFVSLLSRFGEVRTTRFILWPFFNKFMDVYDSHTRCVRTYLTVNCTQTSRPEFCLNTDPKNDTTKAILKTRKAGAKVKSVPTPSKPTLAPPSSGWQSFKTAVKVVLILIMFVLLLLLIYLVLREFEIFRYFWDVGRELVMQFFRRLHF